MSTSKRSIKRRLKIKVRKSRHEQGKVSKLLSLKYKPKELTFDEEMNKLEKSLFG